MSVTQVVDDATSDVYSVELSRAVTSDAGRYDVIADNVMGDVTETCTLSVREADFRQLR